MGRHDDDEENDGVVHLGVYGERPKTRGDCFRMPRPCPWVSCRHHLYLDIDGKGNLKINHPGKELEELAETCALDAAGKTSRTLEEVAVLLSVTRERVRQIEQAALVHLRAEAKKLFADDEETLAALDALLREVED